MLYQLTQEIKSMKQIALDEDGDPDESLTAYLEDLKDDLDHKVEAFCKYIKELERVADIRKAEGRQLMDSGSRIQDRAVTAKKRLMDRLIECGEPKVATDLFTVTVCENGGKIPIEVDEEEVPQNYMQLMKKVDTEKIREQLALGANLTFARQVPRGTHLRIR